MKSFCITMGKDWPLAEAEFNRVGLEVERFDAIVEDNRVLAFNKSVYTCMKLAIDKKPFWHEVQNKWIGGNLVDLLLFEDDVVFDGKSLALFVSENYNIHFFDLIKQRLPSDFLTLHLGSNIIGTDLTQWQMPTAYSQNLAKLHNCLQSHATLYSAECVKFILENFKYVTDEYKTEGCMIFDEWLRLNVLNQGRSYLMKPMIAYQRPRKSEIWNCHADYTGAHLQGNEWLKEHL